MENPTEFDLNAAIQRWQERFDQSPHFHAEDRNELEAHLQDSLTKLRAAGLSDQEAFLIATQRIGSVRTLEPEFAKGDKGASWPKRLTKYRAHYLVFNLVMSALITPDGDPWKMALMAVPLQLLFEVAVWVARDWGQWAKLFNNAIHGLIVVLFTLACVSLFGMLNLIEVTSARVLNGPPPAFTSFCLAWRPVFLALPVLATLYCWWVWVRRGETRNSWMPFFATTMATLVLLTFPTMLSIWLPVVVFMERAAK